MNPASIRAIGFLFIICLGYALKRMGVLKKEDSDVLSRLIMKVTLPVALASNFRGLELDETHLIAFLVGLCSNLLAVGLVLMLSKKQAPAKRAFFMVNVSGYNVSLFAIPFLQIFFAPEALAVVSLFDVGNAIMVFGITLAWALVVADPSQPFSLRGGLRILSQSVPFIVYMGMISLTLLGLRLPSPIFDTLDLIAAANPFIAMLLVGLMFEPQFNREDCGDMLWVIVGRLAVAGICAAVIFLWLPLPLLHKQALTLVLCAPILSIAPIYTEQCGYNRSVSAAVSSLMLPIAMVLMTVLLGVFGLG